MLCTDFSWTTFTSWHQFVSMSPWKSPLLAQHLAQCLAYCQYVTNEWMNEWGLSLLLFLSEDFPPFPPVFCISANIFLENIQKTQTNARVTKRFGQGLVPKDNFPSWSGTCQHPHTADQWVQHWKVVSLLGLLVQGMTLSNSKLLTQTCDVLRAWTWTHLKNLLFCQVQGLSQPFQSCASQTTGSAWC